MQRSCCRCGSEWQIPYLGFGEKQSQAYYRQGILLFLPFYKWPLCSACMTIGRRGSPRLWRLQSAVLLLLSMVLYILFVAALLLVASYVGFELLHGASPALAGASMTLIMVVPVVASLYVLLVR